MQRPRRLRSTAALRRAFQETRLAPDQLVLPIFVVEGLKKTEPIASMPGVFRHSIESAAQLANDARKAGLGGVILFGIPGHKDAQASSAFSESGVVQQAIIAVKNATQGEILTIADTCLCEYTDHGHCGVIKAADVDNDATLPLLARTAVSQAKAGADVIAPSDMMDGRVAAIRNALDAAGFTNTPILSYAAKYASAFYGPFRDAAESAPAFGDRRSYQMDPAASRDALREVLLDIEEGADAIMVKPATAYLDIITRVREITNVPIAAYHVSGEYAMVKAAGANGWIDENRAFMETLISIRRAGADMILSYWSLEAARLLS